MTRRTGSLARLAAVAAVAVAALVTAAGPASAHTSPANFRTAISSVTPAVSGLSVTATPDGGWLRVTNTSSTPVVVLGYEHEPYLKVSAEGVWQNTLSPATYLNRELTIGAVPADVDPQAPPRWVRVSAGPTAQFHDHRVHWMGNGQPPVVAKDPGATHLIETWKVPMLAGATTVTATGTLTWVPSAFNFWPVVLGAAGVLLAIALLVVFLRRQDRRFDRRLARALEGDAAERVTVDS